MMKAIAIQHVHAVAIGGKPNAILAVRKYLVNVIGGQTFLLDIIFHFKIFIKINSRCAAKSCKPNGFIFSGNVENTSIAQFLKETSHRASLWIDSDRPLSIQSGPYKSFRVSI